MTNLNLMDQLNKDMLHVYRNNNFLLWSILQRYTIGYIHLILLHYSSHKPWSMLTFVVMSYAQRKLSKGYANICCILHRQVMTAQDKARFYAN